jgi:hypothetical protein
MSVGAAACAPHVQHISGHTPEFAHTQVRAHGIAARPGEKKTLFQTKKNPARTPDFQVAAASATAT